MGDGHDLYEVHALDEAFANKCPACGEPLQPKDKMCPACGYEVAKLRARVAAKKRGDAERASTSSESSHDVGEQAKGAAGRKRATAKRAKDAPKTPWDDAERTAREADGSTKRETSDGADNVPSEAKPDKKNSDIFLCLLAVLVGLALLPVLASGSFGLMSLGTWGFLILIIVLLTKNKNKS